MPPRHLLAIPDIGQQSLDVCYGSLTYDIIDVQSGRVTIADLAGASAEELQDYLLSLSGGERDAIFYLVTPPFALQSLDANFSYCLTFDKRISPHLDLDHIPESIEMGWKDGLILGIYIAELDCLKQSAIRS